MMMMMMINDAYVIVILCKCIYIYYILANESLASILLRAGLARGSAPPSTLPMALALPSPTPPMTLASMRCMDAWACSPAASIGVIASQCRTATAPSDSRTPTEAPPRMGGRELCIKVEVGKLDHE